MVSVGRDEIYDFCLGGGMFEGVKKVTLQEYIDERSRNQVSILAQLNSGLNDILAQSDPQVSFFSPTQKKLLEN
jgi:hypothetical protein